MTVPSEIPRTPPEAWPPLMRAARVMAKPLARFLGIQASSAVLLAVATAVALAWANSPWASSYESLLQMTVGVSFRGAHVERSLQWIVNDVLMVVFFFVVGMEIRREVHEGELSTPRRAALPVAAALGGMLAPAAVYVGLATQPGAREGWGVPMATDIAFAVGVFAALGKRVPAALRVLLLAVAVIDDLGAILVIAVFYTGGIAWSALAGAALGVAAIYAMQALGVRSRLAYVAPGLVVWAGLYGAGIHPTLAGVIVGFATPVRQWVGPEGFAARIHEEHEALSGDPVDRRELLASLERVELARREALSPSESLIEALHPWVAYAIMPLFAFANAGVSLRGVSLGGAEREVALAITAGLLIGKPLGVLLTSALAIRLKLATLPIGLTRRHLVVLGVVAGIGFTMSLFIAQLAFRDPSLLLAAKVGVLGASAAAVALGLTLGRALLSPEVTPGAAEDVDDAERSTER
ncbi:MAG: Na+/H+ antiporter NhaA [Polyangiales bacterium]